MMGWSREMMVMLANGQLFNSHTRMVESSKWSNFLLKNQSDMDLITTLSKVAPDQGLNF
jgi:hypothetical protein